MSIIFIKDSLAIDIDRMSAQLYEFALYYFQSPTRAPGSSCSTYMWKLLVGSRNLMMRWAEMSPEVLRHMPITTFKGFRYALLVLCNISLLPSETEWDRSIATREARVYEICQKFVENISTLTRATSTTPLDRRDLWSFFCVGVRSMQLWYKRSQQFLDSQTTQAGFSVSEESGHSISDYLHTCSWLILRKHLQEARGILRQSSSLQTGNVQADAQLTGRMEDSMSEMNWDGLDIQTILDDFSMFPFPTAWDELG